MLAWIVVYSRPVRCLNAISLLSAALLAGSTWGCKADFGASQAGDGNPDASTGSDNDAGGNLGFVPSNIRPELVLAGTDPIMLTGLGGIVEINTDNGTIQLPDGTDVRPAGVVFNPEQQTGGPDLCVFSATDLLIGADTEVRVSGTPALVWALSGDATIEGTILATGGRGTVHAAGPGGFTGGRDAILNGDGPGGAPIAIAEDIDIGGGGASHVAIGGKGGDRVAVPGGAAGPVYGTPTLTPLVGGSGGAKGGGDGGGPGGGGGGAVQITALGNIVITNGGINCGGGGGASSSNDDGGGGGGSGGSILLEASNITLNDTRLASNGGGGAAGALDANNPGIVGQPGGLSDIPALGGAAGGEGTAGGNGGAGDSAAGAPGIDGDGGANADNSGGGGGAAGRIFIRAENLTPGDSILSPVEGLGIDTL